MSFIDNIKEATIIQIVSALLGFLILLLGSIYSDVIPIILPIAVQQLPKTVLLKITTLATLLFFLSIGLSFAIYFKFRKKLIPRFGVYWDKNKEAHCPSCEAPLSEYAALIQPPNEPEYSFFCVKCRTNIYLKNNGVPISMIDAQKLINR